MRGSTYDDAVLPAEHGDFIGHKQDFAQWRARLQEEMTDKNTGMMWRAVIDPASDPELPGLLWTNDDDTEIWPLFMNTMHQEVAMHGPLLVTMKPGGILAEWFLTNAERQPLGILYAAPKDTHDDLFEHLQNLLECLLPDGKPGFFRFYDPRVLHALSCFHDQQWASYAVGPSAALHAWDPGRAEAVTLQKGSTRALSEQSLILTDELLDFLAMHNTPYAVLHELTVAEGKDNLPAMPIHQSFRIVEAVFRTLWNSGFRDLEDFCVGAQLALEMQRNLFAEIPVKERLRNGKSETSLLSRLAEFPEKLLLK